MGKLGLALGKGAALGNLGPLGILAILLLLGLCLLLLKLISGNKERP